MLKIKGKIRARASLSGMWKRKGRLMIGRVSCKMKMKVGVRESLSDIMKIKVRVRASHIGIM